MGFNYFRGKGGGCSGGRDLLYSLLHTSYMLESSWRCDDKIVMKSLLFLKTF